MFRNVVDTLNESLDITMHLKPLTGHFEVKHPQGDRPHDAQALESTEFPDVRPLFAPLMHTVRMSSDMILCVRCA